MHTYITDFGENFAIQQGDTTVGHLERYGVWQVRRKGRYEVVEVGNDLPALMQKYQVPAERVVPIGSRPPDPASTLP